jgi:nucleoside-diphosphate kinase
VAAGNAEKIVDMIRAAGFTIVSRKRVGLTASDAGEFYREHHGKAFFEKLVAFMTRLVVRRACGLAV